MLNSGGANCFTGSFRLPDDAPDRREGRRAARRRRRRRAGLLDGPHRHRRRGLPRRRCSTAPSRASPSSAPDGGEAASLAIMTTDSTAEALRGLERDGWTIGGMAKGAGMLAPGPRDDARRDHDRRRARRRAGRRRAAAAPRTSRFDRLDSDGCMSTNDQVTLMASGASGVTPDPDDFAAALDRGVPRPRPAAAGRRRGREPRHHDRGRARGIRSRCGRGRAAPSRATTSSRRRSSATTRTGAGCSPRSARPTPSSTRTTSTSG